MNWKEKKSERKQDAVIPRDEFKLLVLSYIICISALWCRAKCLGEKVAIVIVFGQRVAEYSPAASEKWWLNERKKEISNFLMVIECLFLLQMKNIGRK